MIVKKDVSGPRAISYIKEHVNRSGKTLAELLLTLPLSEGKVFAFVPEDCRNDSLFNFDSGFADDNEVITHDDGSALVPIQNHARPVILAAVRSYLSSDPEHCCIYEDPYGAGFGLSKKIDFSHFHDEYYYLFSQGYHVENLEHALKDGGPYYFLMVLSRLSDAKQADFVSPKILDHELLVEAFQNVNSFFVMAYDWESYLQWLKPNVRSNDAEDL
jgi:hypothetical protein